MRKRFATGLLAAAIVAGLVAAARHELLRSAFGAGAALAGYDVSVGTLQLGNGTLTLSRLRIERKSQPLLSADRLVIGFSVRDLLPGSSRRFGLADVDVSGVKLTLTRFADGSFNLPLPTGATSPGPQRIDEVPFRFALRVRDGSIVLKEPSAFDQSARTLQLNHIDADAAIDTSAITRYRVAGAFDERREEPFSVAGRVDAIAGFATHHVRAARFPLRALSNYFAQSRDVRILHGGARNFDAVLYALDVVPNVAPSYHVSLRLDVDGGRLALSTLALPIENISGRLRVVDGAFFINGARATLAGIPLQFCGGIYDLNGAVTGDAQLRLGVWGSGDLGDLRHAFTFTRDQPISGRGTLDVLVQGRIDDPVIVARASAPHAVYRRLPFDGVFAGVVYHAKVVALAPLQASYGGVAIAVRGMLYTGAHLRSQLALHVAGPADRLPYLDEMLGNEPIVIDASATGNDLLFHVIGGAASLRGIGRVAALVRMNGDGTALVDPFWLHTPRGNLDGGYLLDRPHRTSAFWLIADGLRMHAPAYHAFPNLSLPEMPKIDGGVMHAALAGGGSGNHIVLGGVVGATDTNIAGVQFTKLDATLAGTLASAPINRLRATGPWGTFAGRGDFSSRRFVAFGDYRGSFEGLAPLIGNAVEGRGRLRGTVAIAVEPQRIVVVGSNLSMPGATLRGVPVDRASLTLAVEGDRLRIYSAHAHTAGGDVVAAGTYSLSPSRGGSSSDALALVANRLSTSQLHGIGLPLAGGTLWATGALRAGLPLPAFRGGVAVSDSRIAQFAIAGNGDVDLSGNTVAFARTVGELAGTYARVQGNVGSLTSGAPTYALQTDVPAGAIARTMHAFGFPNYKTDGFFNAELLIGGRSSSPTIAGLVGVPAAEVNGLPFIDGSGRISADSSGVSVRSGSVLVGTTLAHFNADVHPHNEAVQVDAHGADLSDFNNFFDTGDTLDGNGSVRIAAASQGARITSSGNIDVRGFRYRNLPIGDTRAVWSSARNVVVGALAVGGAHGVLRAHGSIDLARGADWLSTVGGSRYDLDTGVRNLDLSFWLPALGMQALPVTGRASGQADFRGRFPLMSARGEASITGGTLGPLTLNTAEIALHAAGRQVVIDRAALATPELSATAAGTLGLDARQPLDVRIYAATNRLSELVYDTSRVRVPVSGSFESTLTLGGTYHAPTLLAGFDATGVLAYGIPINSLFGEIRLSRGALVLSDAGLTLQKGQATLAGSLPLGLSPLRIAAPEQPISFDVDVVGVDPSIFDEALGNNTKLGGVIDGHIGISGSIKRPAVVGRMSLARGSYVSDLERVALTQMVADIVFDHASASIGRISAKAGTGSLAGSGVVEFPAGLESSGVALSLHGAARGAQLDLPAYGSGTLDAALAVGKKPGGTALLSGSVALSNASLPFASFVKAATQASSASALQLPLALDVKATAGKNVRVRGNGYGAGLDIGTAGAVQLGGTLASPTLAGAFESTGGTLTYFDRAFRVREGSVRFDAADGVLPTLHAVANTNVVNPDPDRVRNPYGSAEVTITVEGPIQGLKIGLQSNPAGYSRDEILALIAPFGGFLSGISFSRQSMLARQQPNGITPLGALSPIPNVALRQNSNITVGQEAFNILNAQFTAGLLAPVESTLGQGLGLSSVNLTLGYYGNVGVTATRLLGKAVSAVYAVTFGIPQIQSFGLVAQSGQATAVSLNFFLQSGPTKLLQLPGAPTGYSASYLAGQPLIGNTGFSLTLQHYFW
ncbi:MAG: translocation/assembly module TamB domain-containing protein [Candidatus Cybelea sp.]